MEDAVNGPMEDVVDVSTEGSGGHIVIAGAGCRVAGGNFTPRLSQIRT